jgi:hypothetical protein
MAASSAGWPGRPSGVLAPNSGSLSAIWPPLGWRGVQIGGGEILETSRLRALTFGGALAAAGVVLGYGALETQGELRSDAPVQGTQTKDAEPGPVLENLQSTRQG